MMHFDFDLRSPCGHRGMEWRREFHLFNLGKLVESSHADAGRVDRSYFHRECEPFAELSIEMIPSHRSNRGSNTVAQNGCPRLRCRKRWIFERIIAWLGAHQRLLARGEEHAALASLGCLKIGYPSRRLSLTAEQRNELEIPARQKSEARSAAFDLRSF